MKASEAIQKGIDIDFTVNDLSTLPFETSDMIVLLSNLLDNAIEANQVYCGDKKIHVIALWEKSFFVFHSEYLKSGQSRKQYHSHNQAESATSWLRPF